MAEQKEDASSSTSAFVSSLVFNGLILLILVLAFVALRPKNRRVYEPKTLDLKDTKPEQRPPRAPKGPFQWITFLLSRPQGYLLHYAGVDGYLFLRFISIFAGISFLGCFLILPVLLPVNATNGNSLKGFELLSYSNVKNINRFYAHVFVAWAYFGFIMFVIYKELVYYVSLRHSIQTTPLYDGLLSSRTLSLVNLPEDYLSEDEIRRIFPIYTRLWYARDHTELNKLVEERTKLSTKYEGALNGVIAKGVKLQQKLTKKGETLPTEPQGYIKKEPTHKLGKIPFIGEKVNTIDYSIDKIGELNTDISDRQKNANTAQQLHSVFIEFPNQLEAQRAYQSVPYTDLKKTTRFIGVAPDDIIWSNLKASKTSKTLKRIGANTFLTLLIIFWAIPVAVVGCISNVNFLIEKLPWLSFINNCPPVILGLITGLAPTIALAILMSLVPVFIKLAGKMSGATTKQELDLYCQSWYYGFQVVQVFLVTTLASAASSTVTAIINEPKKASTLLAKNLPKASNFYIVYFLLQGLGMPGMALLQIGPLIVSKVLGFLKNTPRKKWESFNTIGGPSYGVLYPVYQLLVTITFCYAIIQPLMLVFSAFAFALMYIAFLYNLIYVQGVDTDMRGRNYPKALLQIFTGIYLAEICLLGLFIMAETYGPVGLIGALMVATVAFHIWLKYKFVSLYDAVPVNAIYEARGEGSLYPNHDQGFKEIRETGKNYISDNESKGFTSHGLDDTKPPVVPGSSTGGVLGDSNSSRNETVINDGNTNTSRTNEKIGEDGVDVEGGQGNSYDQKQIETETDVNKIGSQAKAQPLDVVKRFFAPKSGYSFALIRSQLPSIFNLSPSYKSEYLDNAYVDPAVSDDEPHIWIPRDPCGLSTYEIEKTGGKVDVSDEHTEYDDKGKFDVTGPPPSYEEAVQT
ncbi:Phosphate metabolism protein 7 [Wickerhamomyces ciferrii]|uniref:Phosphate metabolism protein 7 n=1 Tax=Wickerhamomyces ciferrii (strain ATCC 14091 / BCRC 22168 / CBS 111 / JCM 3599 / NBRC 0793 / NRRL Y-1031 F-60-10) TaxID=1206466 RepID=K0KJK7_WICCF|nr:Phosphate metabolism protein 7 [Wickerhamomyces ciferrii]CCH45450.1 Phosphate metabolism protein 7 [Wickerhamomyces ciferrii]